MIAYGYKDNIYLNITNACTMKCFYCIKDKWAYRYRGYDLRLRKEPGYPQVIRSFKAALSRGGPTGRGGRVAEVVFCGYGEPTMRLGVLKKVASYLKGNSFKVRINTNGHGNLIHKRNIVPELAGIVDSIYVSLNAENPKKYFEMHNPKFGPGAFRGVLDFVKECRKYIPEVVVTTVALPGIDVKKCEKIAKSLGAGFIKRQYLEEYEER
jgi:TatD DNase family protein